jgi:uncharacterized protein YutE (UPF0331/DUF86 family)
MVAARKIATLLRCVERAREEYASAGEGFRTDYTRQDAALLNVTRACESAIDLANALVRQARVGIPGDAKQSFALLETAHLIPAELSRRLQRMVGFRNIAVHQYDDLDLDIVEAVIRNELDELLEFAEIARARLKET